MHANFVPYFYKTESDDAAFLAASSHLFTRPCPSVGPSVCPLVGNAFVKIDDTWPFTDEEERETRRKEGRGGKSGEEERAVRRKERRGGRSDEEEGATSRMERRGE